MPGIWSPRGQIAAPDALSAHIRHELLGPMPAAAVEAIEAHLGGPALMDAIGVRDIAVNHDHVSFRLAKTSPKGVRTVIITTQSDGFFRMACYGGHAPGSFSTPLLASAEQIVPENLATVLGALTGLEALHHRHF